MTPPFKPAMVWILSVGISAAVLGVTGSRLVASSQRARRAEDELARAATLIQELRAARASKPGAVSSPSALQPRIAAVLASVALPPATLNSLAPEPSSGNRSADGARIEHRRATVVLQDLTLSNFGMFLDAWRRAEPRWVVSGIDLSPSGSAPPGADLPVRAALILEHSSVESFTSTASPVDALRRVTE